MTSQDVKAFHGEPGKLLIHLNIAGPQLILFDSTGHPMCFLPLWALGHFGK
jgi:hypothetical protein